MSLHIRRSASYWWARLLFSLFILLLSGCALAGQRPFEGTQTSANLGVTSNVTQSATAASTPLPSAVVNVKVLNLRTGPGTTYDRIDAVYLGDELDVIGEAYVCGWLKVLTPSGTVGWVSGGSPYVVRNLSCSDIPAIEIPPMPTAKPISTSVPEDITSATFLGTINLVAPIHEPSYGLTSFVWEWDGNLPPELGFEVVVWRTGEQPLGIHDAVVDNHQNRLKRIGQNRYRLDVDISRTPSVQERTGEYWWTVRLIQISPAYAITDFQAEPGIFRYRTLNDDRDDNHKENYCPTYGCSTTLPDTTDFSNVVSTAAWLALGLLVGVTLVTREAISPKDD